MQPPKPPARRPTVASRRSSAPTDETAPESMVLLVETVDVLLKTVARLNDTVRILHGRMERELARREARDDA